MTSTRLTPQPDEPAQALVASVLDTFLSATSWDAARQIIASHLDVLLSSTADRLIEQMLTESRNSEQLELQQAERELTILRMFLQHTREIGFTPAWQQFEEEQQQKLQQLQQYRQTIAPTLDAWFETEGLYAKRRFLEEHLELLTADCEQFVQHLIAQQRDRPELAQILFIHLLVLQDARRRGASVDAVKETYINIATILVLDLPLWLDQIIHDVEVFSHPSQAQQTVQKRITLLRDALERVERAGLLPPEVQADLLNRLGRLLQEVQVQSRQMVEEAIRLHTAALQVYTRARYPLRYAQIMVHLGEASVYRPTSNQEANIEQALRYYTEAAQVYSAYPPEIFSEEWTTVQLGLGELYRRRLAGAKRENIEKALAYFQSIVQVHTYESAPLYWAAAQSNMGTAHLERIAGEKSENLERARDHYLAALRVYTAQGHPRKWVKLQHNLGIIYQERTRGSRRENIEQAIAYLEASLQVYTREAFPRDWAATCARLGNIYRERVAGDHAQNVEQAIIYYEQALQVYTREDFADEWARVQNSFGNACMERIVGKRRENLEQARAHIENALVVHTLAAYPDEWAMYQTNLALIYFRRVAGERMQNLEQAIACYQAALKVETRETHPERWGNIQNGLAVIYMERLRGEAYANMEEAIRYAQAALLVRTKETTPADWAMTRLNLSGIYFYRLAGVRRSNLEQALMHAESALQVYTLEDYPAEWASVNLNMGVIYWERIEGERRINLERSIQHCHSALQVYTQQDYPLDWAKAMMYLGNAYQARILGNKISNIEQAIAYYQAALQEFSYDHAPVEWALLQMNLGGIYWQRLKEGRTINLERAITYFNAALRYYNQKAFPAQWAKTQVNLSNVYKDLPGEGKREHLMQAMLHCEAASQVYTHKLFPNEWARLQLSIAVIHLEWVTLASITLEEQKGHLESAVNACKEAYQVYTLDAFPAEYRRTSYVLAQAAGLQQDWQEVHTACTAMSQAEDLLTKLGSGITGRDAVSRDMSGGAAMDAFALVRLGRVEEAVLAIEHGRTRGLAEALALDAATPDLIADADLRKHYINARARFSAAQKRLNEPLVAEYSAERQHALLTNTAAYHEAQAQLDAVVAQIRAARDPADFLPGELDIETIRNAASIGGTGHTLIYLLATFWGGLALALTSKDGSGTPRFLALELPRLTTTLVIDLCQTTLNEDPESLIGGFYAAQLGTQRNILPAQVLQMSWQEMTRGISETCTTMGKQGLLVEAMLALRENPDLAPLLTQPLGELEHLQLLPILRATVAHIFLQRELQRCGALLAEVAIHPLVAELRKRQVASITLIPCGPLAAFPFTSFLIDEEHTLGDIFPTSVAPSARALLPSTETQQSQRRAGIYALGDPATSATPLEWGEAEARTLNKLARSMGLPSEVVTGERATEDWLLDKLQHGLVVDASCHGRFDQTDFLRSALILAGGKRLTLASMLTGQARLHGLRLVILSACQTAIPNIAEAADEVHSLAVGMLQAGAKAVLAALWPVDDQATYLLITRFAHEWFPHLETEPPAAALARAQHWLRNLSNKKLKEWNSLHPFAPTRNFAPITTQEAIHTHHIEAQLIMVRSDGYRIPLEYPQPDKTRRPENDYEEDRPYQDPIYWAGFQVTGW